MSKKDTAKGQFEVLQAAANKHRRDVLLMIMGTLINRFECDERSVLDEKLFRSMITIIGMFEGEGAAANMEKGITLAGIFLDSSFQLMEYAVVSERPCDSCDEKDTCTLAKSEKRCSTGDNPMLKFTMGD